LDCCIISRLGGGDIRLQTAAGNVVIIMSDDADVLKKSHLSYCKMSDVVDLRKSYVVLP